ncbi:hypothetical protein BESB_065240 [Besnoitia besnoiti]|uniref:Uncharacterized protein n=1 Tax=Besnoitia besnoiti TaxID=94643 RepID=A0A2A9MGH5_BESBE|nr:hypothetical protein BESB_065240 [Besnoitia besnoiti]PFH34492.1 hypothetical protein BESB_065240 [Besnoitia besnoiti]
MMRPKANSLAQGEIGAPPASSICSADLADGESDPEALHPLLWNSRLRRGQGGRRYIIGSLNASAPRGDFRVVVPALWSTWETRFWDWWRRLRRRPRAALGQEASKLCEVLQNAEAVATGPPAGISHRDGFFPRLLMTALWDSLQPQDPPMQEVFEAA